MAYGVLRLGVAHAQPASAGSADAPEPSPEPAPSIATPDLRLPEREVDPVDAPPKLPQRSVTLTPIPRPTGDAKSFAAACGYSLGVTAGGVGLVLIGAANKGHVDAIYYGGLAAGGAVLAIGPTAGHIYADDPLGGWAVLRIFGGIIGFVGGVGASHETGDFSADIQNGVMAFVGGLTYTIGMVGELTTLPHAVDRYNHKHHFDTELTLAPIATPAGTTPGLAIVGRF